MIKHKHPTPATQKHVLAASGNQCAFPGCSNLIFDLEHATLIGTIAHIKARSEGGARFDHDQSEENNRSFSNLVGMCAEHSKIIDGPKWRNFSVECLFSWKSEHEQKISDDTDRSWIRPPSSIIRISPNGDNLQFTYWLDRKGRPRLFNASQLAVINTLMTLNLTLIKMANLPQMLEEASTLDVAAVLQQEWAKFEIERSVMADFCTMLAMANNITFAEFLGFLVQGNDPSPLIQEAVQRVELIANGNTDKLVKNWFKTDIYE
tara:strand:- start:1274 stop:2062 length:789 start_codon:yes stop_codon:yes gene_type:complete